MLRLLLPPSANSSSSWTESKAWFTFGCAGLTRWRQQGWVGCFCGGLGDFFLTQQYLEIMRRVLSNEGSWSVVNGKYIQLYPAPTETPTPVIVEYRALDSNTINHAYRSWIQRYALACAKSILGRIRGKYRTLPGPGGGAQLDGETLTRESAEDKKLLIEELMSEIEERPMFIVG